MESLPIYDEDGEDSVFILVLNSILLVGMLSYKINMYGKCLSFLVGLFVYLLTMYRLKTLGSREGFKRL